MAAAQPRGNIADLKARIDIADFIRSYGVELRKDGGEYKACCPFHDERTPSFTVTPANGLFKCFGCGAGGSVVDFAQQWHGVPLAEAIRKVEEWAGGVALASPEQAQAKREAHAKKRDEWQPIVPVPADAPAPTFKHRKYDNLAATWAYRDAAGQLIGYVARFHFPKVDKETGEETVGKDVLPTVYAQNSETGKREWRWLSFPKPRPLYGLDLLAQHPDALVLIVEGEKTADAARELLPIGAQGVPPVVVISWPGGGKAIELVDWSLLQGRRCALWPDADPPGFATMEGWINGRREAEDGIAQLLTGTAASIKVIQPPQGVEEGWDIADAKAEGWTTADLLQHIKANIRDHRTPVPMQVQAPEPAPPINDNEPPLESYADMGGAPYALDDDEDPASDEPFRCLGYGPGPTYYYMPNGTHLVTELTPGGHSERNLIALAPLRYWERAYGDGSKLKKESWVMAANALMQMNHGVGMFNPDTIRGRGAWWDDGRAALHLGRSVIIDGKRHELNNVPSRYVYQQGKPLEVSLDNPLVSSEAVNLVKICELLSWEKPINGKLLAGWCMLAPICGALRWRPHIWITGSAGSGKTTAMGAIVHRTLGETCMYVQSATTEAGLRQELQSDSLPVVFDEIESEDKRAEERINNVMTLATQASSETGARIVKGSATGHAMSYNIRSMFAFSSIAINLKQYATRTRVTVLSLIRRPPTEENQAIYKQLLRMIDDTLTPEYVQRLHARAINLIPVIRKNAETFTAAAAIVLNSQRLGDQVGALLAGAYALHSANEISRAEAEKWIAAQDWQEVASIADTSDESSCLNHIMETLLDVETDKGRVKRTIKELIEVSTFRRQEGGLNNIDAHDLLKRYGIKIASDMQKLLVANNNVQLKRILADTPWGNAWGDTLSRIDGAEKHRQERFGTGTKDSQRCVAIPMSVIF